MTSNQILTAIDSAAFRTLPADAPLVARVVLAWDRYVAGLGSYDEYLTLKEQDDREMAEAHATIARLFA